MVVDGNKDGPIIQSFGAPEETKHGSEVRFLAHLERNDSQVSLLQKILAP